MKHNLNDEELLVVFEAARIALSDGDIFDSIAEQMDLSDEDLAEVREKLEQEMKVS